MVHAREEGRESDGQTNGHFRGAHTFVWSSSKDPKDREDPKRVMMSSRASVGRNGDRHIGIREINTREEGNVPEPNLFEKAAVDDDGDVRHQIKIKIQVDIHCHSHHNNCIAVDGTSYYLSLPTPPPTLSPQGLRLSTSWLSSSSTPRALFSFSNI